jgi:Family of unknown function (DUF6338)
MPSTIEALAILVLFFLPGYLAASWYVRNEPHAEASGLPFLLAIAAWAAVIHSIAFPWTVPLVLALQKDPVGAAEDFQHWFVVVVLVVPVLLGSFSGYLMRTRRVGRVLARLGMSVDTELPTAWDFALRGGRPGTYVLARLRDGDALIGGKLGTQSLAGVSPHRHDLFLEERWDLDSDGWFARPTASSRGIWLSADQLKYVEFFKGSG